MAVPDIFDAVSGGSAAKPAPAPDIFDAIESPAVTSTPDVFDSLDTPPAPVPRLKGPIAPAVTAPDRPGVIGAIKDVGAGIARGGLGFAESLTEIPRAVQNVTGGIADFAGLSTVIGNGLSTRGKQYEFSPETGKVEPVATESIIPDIQRDLARPVGQRIEEERAMVKGGFQGVIDRTPAIQESAQAQSGRAEGKLPTLRAGLSSAAESVGMMIPAMTNPVIMWSTYGAPALNDLMTEYREQSGTTQGGEGKAIAGGLAEFILQGGVETLSTALEKKFFAGAKLPAPIKQKFAKTLMEWGKMVAKGYPKAAITELLEETVQGEGSGIIRRMLGMEAAAPGEATRQAALPTAIAVAMFGPLMAGSAIYDQRQRADVLDAAKNANVPADIVSGLEKAQTPEKWVENAKRLDDWRKAQIAAAQAPTAAAPIPEQPAAPVVATEQPAAPAQAPTVKEPPAYDQEASQLRYPDVTAQVQDRRFKMYLDAKYTRQQALDMVAADQAEEVLASAGVQNITPEAQAAVAEKIKTGQPVDAQIIADATGSEVDVGRLNDHLKLSELGYTGPEIAALEAEPGLVQLKDIITNNRSKQLPTPAAGVQPAPVGTASSPVSPTGAGVGSSLSTRTQDNQAVQQQPETAPDAAVSLPPPESVTPQLQVRPDTRTATETEAGETIQKNAGLTTDEARMQNDTRPDDDLTKEEYSAKQRGKTKLKREKQHESELSALKEAGVNLDESVTNPKDGSRNFITGWTRDEKGVIQVRIENHSGSSMRTRLVSVIPGDTITEGMDDSKAGTTRSSGAPPAPSKSAQAKAKVKASLAKREGEGAEPVAAKSPELMTPEDRISSAIDHPDRDMRMVLGAADESEMPVYTSIEAAAKANPQARFHGTSADTAHRVLRGEAVRPSPTWKEEGGPSGVLLSDAPDAITRKFGRVTLIIDPTKLPPSESPAEENLRIGNVAQVKEVPSSAVIGIAVHKGDRYVYRAPAPVESKPAKASVVTTELYHGTPNEFNDFDATKSDSRDAGIWFHDNETVARGYGTVGLSPVRVIKAKLNITNPYVTESRDVKITPEKIEELKRQGHDGVKRVLDQEGAEWAVFDPSQIEKTGETRETYEEFKARTAPKPLTGAEKLREKVRKPKNTPMNREPPGGWTDADKVRTIVGVNRDGVKVEKDKLGARSILANGFRNTQPVQIVPGMGTGAGILTPEELFKSGRTEFLTVEELAKFKGDQVPAKTGLPGKSSGVISTEGQYREDYIDYIQGIRADEPNEPAGIPREALKSIREGVLIDYPKESRPPSASAPTPTPLEVLRDKVAGAIERGEKEAVVEQSPASGIRVTENEQHDGVEIHFPGKPSGLMITAVKSHGFRWSPRQKVWYAKRTPERLKWARGLETAEKEMAGSTQVEKPSTAVEESKPLTTTLRDGSVVLAKMYDGSPSAMTFANRTQAEAAVVKHGGEVYRTAGGRPFYVRFPDTETEAEAPAFKSGDRVTADEGSGVVVNVGGGQVRILLDSGNYSKYIPAGRVQLEAGKTAPNAEPKPDKALIIPRRAPNGGVSIEVQPIREPRPEVKSPTANLSESDAARLKEIQARLRKKIMGQANMGFDPEILTLAGEMATLYAKGGIKTFKQFAGSVKADMADMWEQMKSYLHSAWQAAGAVDESLEDVSRSEAKTAIDEIEAQQDNTQGGNEDESGSDLGKRERGTEAEDAESTGGQSGANGNQPRGRVGGDESEAAPGDGSRRDASGEGARGPGAGSEGPETGQRGRDDASQRGGSQRTVRRAEPQAVAATNYRITPEDRIGKGGLASKYRDNVAAIRLLKKIEEEGRTATPAEQAVLVRYVGWGGIKGAFDPRNEKMRDKYTELVSLLTPEEFEAARRSVQDAHYTSETIVKDGVYAAMKRFGFPGGAMIEAGLGTGHFIGMMPDEMRGRSTYMGIEQDPLTARIAQQLYPEAKIHNVGFQDADLTRGIFDGAVGNPPFGSQSLYDKNFKDESKHSIHNYFIAKTLALLRPGGVSGFVVSHYFLDSQDPSARRHIAGVGEFLGAIRLPNTAFKENANTEVTTDLVFLRRRAEGEKGAVDNDEAWLNSGVVIGNNGEKITVNRWLADNPDMMLGVPSLAGKLHGGEEFTLEPRQDQDLSKDLTEAVGKLPEDVYSVNTRETEERLTTPEPVSIPDEAKVGNMFVGEDGRIMRRVSDEMLQARAEPVETKDALSRDRIKGMIGVRDALNRLVSAERSDEATDSELAQLRQDLNDTYDAFKSKWGYLNQDRNRRLFYDDREANRILALESGFDRGVSAESAKKQGIPSRKMTAGKAAIFEKRVNAPYREITSVETPKEALMASLNQRGMVDLDYMAKISGKSVEDLESALGDLVFKTPAGDHQSKEQYLSGNVRKKLAEAKLAAEKDPSYQKNVEALTNAIPNDIAPTEIIAPIGAPWVDAEDVIKFAEDLTGTSPSMTLFRKHDAGWSFEHSGSNTADTQTWGTQRMPFGELMKALLNGKPIVVYDTSRDEKGNETKIVNQTDTALAQSKADELKERWQTWLWEDKDRRDRLHRVYNDRYNNYVDPHYDGSHLELPGMSALIQMRPHQKNVIWRTLTDMTALYDHVVGAGKTFAGVSSFMEMKRLGRVRKPLFVVPNHLVRQWRDDFVKLYPNANVLHTEPSDFQKDRRQKLFAKVMTGDYDAVIIGHSSFKKIGVSPEVESKFLKEMVDEITSSIEETREAEHKAGRRKRSRTLAQMEKTKEALESKMDALADRTGAKDQVATFEELGIDGLFVDEAHEFKNLFYTTQMQNVAGMGDPQGSGKAFDLYIKTRYMRDRFGGKAPIVFATGTPISNSLVEMYTMQRYLQPQVLEDMGAKTLDGWARVFADVRGVYEVDPTGTGYRLSTRFANFQNVGELSAAYRSVADVVTMADLQATAEAEGKRFPVPRLKDGKPNNIVSERSKDQSDYFGVPTQEVDSEGNPAFDNEGNPRMSYPPGTILYRVDNMPKDPSVDNMLKLTNDARKAGLDMRLVSPGCADHPGSKINRAVKEIVRVYRKWHADKGTQLVFCDLSVPSSSRGKATAKAKQDATGGEFYYRNIGDGRLSPVEDAKPVTLGNEPEGVQFFAYKDGDEWSITERKSGLRVAADKSQKLAIIKAKSRIESIANLPKMIEDQAPAQAVVEAAREKWKQEREAAAANKTEPEADQGAEAEATQAVSMDELLADGSDFSVYDDVKKKLIKAGIPEHEIAFIHDFDTPDKKAKLFGNVNNGNVRILMGSTPKMGAGMNVQERLVAAHHLDAPWRPSDLEQREGRIVRQGNQLYMRDPDGFNVEILRYATDRTYDTRMWQLIEHKAAGIEGFRRADRSTRTIEDVGGEAANAADMKAAASGDPRIQKELQLRNDRTKLENLEKAWRRNRYELEGRREWLKGANERMKSAVDAAAALIRVRDANTTEKFSAKLLDGTTTDAKGDMIAGIADGLKKGEFSGEIGAYRGFSMKWINIMGELRVYAKPPAASEYDQVTTYSKKDRLDGVGFFHRMDNWMGRFEGRVEQATQMAAKERADSIEVAKELEKSFSKADDLARVRTEHETVRRELMEKKKPAAQTPSVQASRAPATPGAGLTETFPAAVSAEVKTLPFAGDNAYGHASLEDAPQAVQDAVRRGEGQAAKAKASRSLAGMIPERGEHYEVLPKGVKNPLMRGSSQFWLTDDGRWIDAKGEHADAATEISEKSGIPSNDLPIIRIYNEGANKRLFIDDTYQTATPSQLEEARYAAILNNLRLVDGDLNDITDESPRFFRSPTGQVRAVTIGSESHFFLDRYQTDAQLHEDIREEAGHRLVNELGGEAWRKIGMLTYRGRWTAIRDEIQRNYGFKAGTPEFNHELIAKAFRDGKADGNIMRRFMDAVVSAFRALARRLGFDVTLSDAEVRNALRGMLEAKAKGMRGSGATTPGVLYADNATITRPGGPSAQFMVEAFHGTPHTFEPEPDAPFGRVKKEKVGSGEGAAAYGWGVLYTAEEKSVAENYRDRLQKPWWDRILIDGKPMPSSLVNVRPDIDAILGDLADNGKESAIRVAQGVIKDAPAESVKLRASVQRMIRDIQSGVITQSSDAGNVYHVELDLGPEDTLDWDKPLSAQSDKVRQALFMDYGAMQGFNADPRGQQIYRDLSNRESAKESGLKGRIGYEGENKRAASEYLASLGIKGIRYADQGSRSDQYGVSRIWANEKYPSRPQWQVSAPNGYNESFATEADARADADERNAQKTYNYVVFNESDIRVVGRNGETLKPAEAMRGVQAAKSFRNGVVTPEQDARYLELAKDPEKNAAELQRMVDEAARAAGYNVGPVYRRSHRNIQSELESSRAGIFWSNDSGYTDQFGGKEGVRSSAFIRIEKPYYADAEEIEHLHIHRAELASVLKSHDGIIERNTKDTEIAEPGEEHQFVTRNASQSKSADAITYDDNGDPISLADRFNDASPDIRYARSETKQGDEDERERAIRENRQDSTGRDNVGGREAERVVSTRLRRQRRLDAIVQNAVGAGQEAAWHRGLRLSDDLSRRDAFLHIESAADRFGVEVLPLVDFIRSGVYTSGPEGETIAIRDQDEAGIIYTGRHELTHMLQHRGDKDAGDLSDQVDKGGKLFAEILMDQQSKPDVWLAYHKRAADELGLTKEQSILEQNKPAMTRKVLGYVAQEIAATKAGGRTDVDGAFWSVATANRIVKRIHEKLGLDELTLRFAPFGAFNDADFGSLPPLNIRRINTFPESQDAPTTQEEQRRYANERCHKLTAAFMQIAPGGEAVVLTESGRPDDIFHSVFRIPNTTTYLDAERAYFGREEMTARFGSNIEARTTDASEIRRLIPGDKARGSGEARALAVRLLKWSDTITNPRSGISVFDSITREMRTMTPAERAFAAGAQGGQRIESEAGKAEQKTKLDALRERMKAQRETATGKAREAGDAKVLKQAGKIGEMLAEFDEGKAAISIAEGRMSIRAAANRLVNANLVQQRDLRKELISAVKASVPDASVRDTLSRKILAAMLRRRIDQPAMDAALGQLDRLMDKAQREKLIGAIISVYSKAVESMAINVSYRQRIRQLMDGFLMKKPTAASLAKAKELADFLEAEAAAGSDIDLTINRKMAKMLEKLSKVPLASLDVSQLEDIFADLSMLAERGKMLQQGKRQQEIDRMQADVDAMKAQGVRRFDAPVKEIGNIGEPPRFTQRFTDAMASAGDAMKKWYLWHLPTDRLFDLMDDYQHYKGAIYRLFKARPNMAFKMFRADLFPVEQELKEMLARHKIGRRESMRIGMYGVDQQTMDSDPQYGRRKLYNNFGADTPERMAEVDRQVDAIELTPDERAVYEWMLTKFESVAPALQKTANEVYNVEFDKVKKYWPMQTDWEITENDPIAGYEMNDYGQLMKKNPEKGMIKARTGAGGQKVQIDSARGFIKHMSDAYYMIHMAPVTKYMAELARHPEMVGLVGKEGQRMLLEFTDTMARKGGVSGDHVIRWVDTLRRNVGVGTLGFRVTSALIQPTSFINAIGVLGPRGFKGAFDLTQPGRLKWIVDNSTEIRDRVGDDPSFTEWGGTRAAQKFVNAGYWALERLDRLTAAAVFAAAYEANLRERGMVADYSRPADREAMLAAENVVRVTQASGSYKDTPLGVSRGKLLKSHSLSRMLYQFQTFSMNTFAYVAHDGIGNAVNNKEFGRAANMVLWTTLAFMAEEGIRAGIAGVLGGGGDDDKDYGEEIMWDFLGTVPLFGQLAGSMRYSTVPIPLVSAVTKVSKGLSSATMGAKPETRQRGMVRTAGALATLSGVPGSSQVSDLLARGITSDQEDVREAIMDSAKRLPSRASQGRLNLEALRVYNRMKMERKLKPGTTLPEFRARYRAAFKGLNP